MVTQTLVNSLGMLSMYVFPTSCEKKAKSADPLQQLASTPTHIISKVSEKQLSKFRIEFLYIDVALIEGLLDTNHEGGKVWVLRKSYVERILGFYEIGICLQEGSACTYDFLLQEVDQPRLSPRQWGYLCSVRQDLHALPGWHSPKLTAQSNLMHDYAI